MGYFAYAFIVLLIGINAANAGIFNSDTDELSQAIDKLHEIAESTTEKAAKFTGKARHIVKGSSKHITSILTAFRKTVGANVKDAVSFVAHELTPEDAPECLIDNEKKAAKLIGSTVEEVSKCVSTPYTSIIKRIEDLVLAGDKATVAENSYVERIEDCNDSDDKAYCLANILLDVQETVGELAGATSEEVVNIGKALAGLEEAIASCNFQTILSAIVKVVSIGFDIRRCTKESEDFSIF